MADEARRPSFALADLAAGQRSLRKVKAKKKRDRSAPAIAASAADAAERKAEEDTRREYFFETGIDRMVEILGEDLTFPTSSLVIERDEARFIVDWWWKFCHNDAAKEAREASGVAAALPEELQALASRIDATMEKRGWGGGSGAFVKLSTRSAKDSTIAFDTAAALYKERLQEAEERAAGAVVDLNSRLRLLCEAMGASLKVESGEEAVLHMLHSERVWEDLTYALSGQLADDTTAAALPADADESAAAPGGTPGGAPGVAAVHFRERISVVVRGWSELPLWSEFRGFVWGGKLNAVAQYFHPIRFAELQPAATRAAIIEDLTAFFDRELSDKIPLDTYIVDFVWKPDGTTLLVEVNPFDGVLGSFAASTGLFSWDADRAILTGVADEEGGDGGGEGGGAAADAEDVDPRPAFVLRVREEAKAEAYVKNELRPEWRDVLYLQGNHRQCHR